MERVLANYHTHTVYCDGQDTPRALAEAALARGLYALGFSGHSDDIVAHYGMDEEAFCRYREDILACKREYAGRIEILLGLEIDSFTPKPVPGLDYTIGSVHYILAENGRHYCVDESHAQALDCLNAGFGGDKNAFVSAYYQETRRMLREIRPDILGHFDVIRKLNSENCLFDPTSPAYKRAAIGALEEAVALGCIVEVNTGGMVKGYVDTPYPDRFLLERLNALGGKVMINSDSHKASHIDHAFDKAAALLYAAGFRERMELNSEGFYSVKL